MMFACFFIHFAPLIILLLFPMHWLAKMDPDASIILCLEHPGPFLLASAYDFACFFIHFAPLIILLFFTYEFIATAVKT